MTFEPLEMLISHCSTTHRLMRDGFAIATFRPNRWQTGNWSLPDNFGIARHPPTISKHYATYRY